MKKVIIFIACITLLGSCTLFEKKRNNGVVAECKGKMISWHEMDQLTAGLSAADSAAFAEHYIHQWAIDILEYDIARDKSKKYIDQLVEDYRRSLYIHEYEERLIAQRMPREVPDTLIQSFYESHRHQLILRNDIVQGLLLVTPKDAPNLDKLRKMIKDPHNEENIEWIEKFAYQYAVGYELFLEEWKSTNEVIVYLPFDKNDFDNVLSTMGKASATEVKRAYISSISLPDDVQQWLKDPAQRHAVL